MSIVFDPAANEIHFHGDLRPRHDADAAEIIATLSRCIRETANKVFVNVKQLTHLNQTGFRAIARVLLAECKSKPGLKVVIVVSSVIAWAARQFGQLEFLSGQIEVNVYDSAFYPGQTFVEDNDFIPILRTQTKMTWRHERELLSKHGLVPDAAVADICCGIGDFAILLKKHFFPSRLVALDHSANSLNYARRVALELGIEGIEYTYGDASQMLLADNSFDFVTCRHSLQIFDKPTALLGELFRICKPGGRVYITNEKNSDCLGEPRAESINWTYVEVAKLFAHYSMDVEMGPKGRAMLLDAGFEDVRIDSFMVTNLDGDPQEFADVIAAWENMYAGQMAPRRGDSEAFLARFRQGFQDHIFAALHPKGYAGWPIWAASGQKPL